MQPLLDHRNLVQTLIIGFVVLDLAVPSATMASENIQELIQQRDLEVGQVMTDGPHQGQFAVCNGGGYVAIAKEHTLKQLDLEKCPDPPTVLALIDGLRDRDESNMYLAESSFAPRIPVLPGFIAHDVMSRTDTGAHASPGFAAVEDAPLQLLINNRQVMAGWLSYADGAFMLFHTCGTNKAVNFEPPFEVIWTTTRVAERNHCLSTGQINQILRNQELRPISSSSPVPSSTPQGKGTKQIATHLYHIRGRS
jgi:hypothetical protein